MHDVLPLNQHPNHRNFKFQLDTASDIIIIFEHTWRTLNQTILLTCCTKNARITIIPYKYWENSSAPFSATIILKQIRPLLDERSKFKYCRLTVH